ncbi:MAG: ABC transporter permease, partial [Solirubrobacteraceae bacterium]
MSAAAETPPPPNAPAAAPERSRLPGRELLSVAVQGLRSRKLRAGLSALGIAIGIGAMVAVVGVSASAQANLLAEIDALGTNLLTASPSTDFTGKSTPLPATAPQMISAVAHVQGAAAVYNTGQSVFRTAYVPSEETGGLNVVADTGDLPKIIGAGMISGRFLGAVRQQLPEAVLGSDAAQNLQIYRLDGQVMVSIGKAWFTVIGIMGNAALDTSLNSDVFVSLPLATKDFKTKSHAGTIYVRSDKNSVRTVSDLLGPTANPQDQSGVSVS